MTRDDRAKLDAVHDFIIQVKNNKEFDPSNGGMTARAVFETETRKDIASITKAVQGLAGDVKTIVDCIPKITQDVAVNKTNIIANEKRHRGLVTTLKYMLGSLFTLAGIVIAVWKLVFP